MIPFPLQWPPGLARYGRQREAGQFRTSLAGALSNVQGALKAFGSESRSPVTDIVLSSNVALGAPNPEDPGVAVWFKWDGEQRCIAVDRYSKPEANLQAIFHVLEARRTELRHGTLAMVRASMAGLMALPAPSESWRKVFALQPDAQLTGAELDALYRLAVKAPGADLTTINIARDKARKELNL